MKKAMGQKATEWRLQQVMLGQVRLIEEINGILSEEQKKDDVLRAVVRTSGEHSENDLDLPDPDRVFDRDAIRSLCIKYRLRFLPSKYFKDDLPLQAIHALRRLEERTDRPLRGFHIMAPAERFRLCDCDADPLLFVPIGNDRYYLVHRWGGDLRWHRALRAWMFRSPQELSLTVLMVGCLLGLLVPNALIAPLPDAAYWGGHRILCMVWCTLVTSSFAVFSWFAFFGQFSREAWNSKTFN